MRASEPARKRERERERERARARERERVSVYTCVFVCVPCSIAGGHGRGGGEQAGPAFRIRRKAQKYLRCAKDSRSHLLIY